MRVTQMMMMRNSLERLNRRTSNISRLQDIISTGKEIEKPSDDPVRFSRAERMNRMLQRNERFQSTIDRASGWIDSTDLGLQQLSEITADAIEVAQRASDGTIEGEVLESLRKKVEAMIEDALSIANSDYVGKSLFAGTDTGLSEPFTLNSGVVSYTGNDDVIRREFSDNLFAAINITGQEILDTQLFQELTSLEAALAAGDKATIQASIDSMKTVQDNFSGLTATIGSVKKSMTLAEDRLAAAKLNLQEFISDEEDADMVEAIIKFESEQTAYQAALRVTSEVSQMNILQYL